MRPHSASSSSSKETTGQPSARATSKRASSSSRLHKSAGLSQKAAANSVLYLEQSHVKFNAPSKGESVFFDECNREIISVTSGIEVPGETKLKTRVIFQSVLAGVINDDAGIEFLLPIEKRMLSIKLNSSRSVLAYHVERNIIELVNVRERAEVSNGQAKYELDGKRYIQASRAKNSKLIGFLWTGPMELIMITDLSVEYYHVDAARRRLKNVKLFQSATNWFVYQPSPPVERHLSDEESTSAADQYSILMVSTGSLGNSMQPYMFTQGQIVRLQRFEVEGSWHETEKLELFERSITIAHIYGYVRLLVLQHESLNIRTRGAQIVIYTVDHGSGTTTKTHTLDLDVSGRFAINVYDNLIIAHNQPSKTSSIFDIMIESTEKSDCPKHFVCLIDSRPIKQLKVRFEKDNCDKAIEMYSLNWVFFQPNFIIDAKLGLLSSLKLDLHEIQRAITDPLPLLNFLAHRRNSEPIILARCKQIVDESYTVAMKSNHVGAPQTNPLADVSSALEVIGKLMVSAPELDHTRRSVSQEDAGKRSTSMSRGVGAKATERASCFGARLNQEDFQREVLKLLESRQDESNPASLQFHVATLLEIIFVLRRQEKAVEFCIYEQLVMCLLRSRSFYQIVQMIRSEVLCDSKQLACLLLSARNQYRPASQLGLDMLNRLDCLSGLTVDAVDLDSNSIRSSLVDQVAASSLSSEHHTVGPQIAT